MKWIFPLTALFFFQNAYAQAPKKDHNIDKFILPKVEQDPSSADTFLPKNQKGQLIFNKPGYCVGIIVVDQETTYAIVYNRSKKLVSKLNLRKASATQVKKWQKQYGVIPAPPPPPPPVILFDEAPSDYNKEMPAITDPPPNPNFIISEPEFMEDWINFLSRNLKYPDTCIVDNITGTVLIDFMVKKNGTVTELKVNPLSPQKNIFLVKEAIRVLKLTSGKWNPGQKGKVKVDTYHQQPIHFVLTDK